MNPYLLRRSLHATLAALLAVAVASPASATSVDLDDASVSLCDEYPEVCPVIAQPPTVCELSYVLCDLIGSLPEVQCRNDAWSCVDAALGAVSDAYDRLGVVAMLDQDDDRVPDALEGEMCGRTVVRDLIAEVPNGGTCRSGTDYDGDVNSLYLFVPTGQSLGGDYDGDGVPGALVLHGHYVVVNVEQGDLLDSFPSDSWQTLDGNDFDRNTPVPHDDVEGAVALAEQQVAALVAEAEAQAAALVATGQWLGSLLFALVEGTAEEAVGTADATASYAWNEAMGTWQPVWDAAEATVDDAVALAWDTAWWAYDEALRIAGDAVETVDGDGDRFPDAMEGTMCYVENSNSPLDGTCYYGDYRPPY